MENDDVPLFLRPKLRLFLSADLVGSTALKQRQGNPFAKPRQEDAFRDLAPAWLSPLALLYRGIEAAFLERWDDYENKTASLFSWPIGSRPAFWKGIGDEVIYVKTLTDPREAWACLLAWVSGLQQFRGDLRKVTPDLDIKSAAWLAGFPFTNTEAAVAHFPDRIAPEEARLEQELDRSSAQLLHYYRLERLSDDEHENIRSAFVRDYWGPSIDVGFRVASKATPRKLTITADLAFLLAKTSQPDQSQKKKMPGTIFDTHCPIRYDGRVELKGVLGGKPNPLFWLVVISADDLLSIEDRLLGFENRKNKAHEDHKEFCDLFIDQSGGYLTHPFIEDDIEERLGSKPTHFDERLRNLAERYREELNRVRQVQVQEHETDNGSGPEQISDAEVTGFQVVRAHRPDQ